jgi:hypothetical protein
MKRWPGCAAGLDVEHAAGHDAGAVEHRELVGRAHEGGVAVTPAHHLGDGQRLEGVLDDAGEHLGELRAGHRAGVEQGLGLAVHAALEAGHGGQGMPLASSFLVRAGVGWPSAVEGHGHRHDLLGHVLGGGFGSTPARVTARRRGVANQRKAPSAAPGHGRAGRHDAVGKGLAELGQGLGREFFGQQFYEQGRAGHHAASFLSIGKPRASREL